MDFEVTNSEQSDARVGTTRFHGYSRVQQMELEKKTPDIVNVHAQLELD